MTFRREPQQIHGLWVLVANRAHARIFRADDAGLKEFNEVKVLVHPASEAHSRDVLTDRPGRFPGQSGGASAGDSETDFKHQTATEFACQVIDELERGRTHNEFDQLVVVAPPLFLGVLRKHLPGPLAKLVKIEIDKDIVPLLASDIRELVRKSLPVDAAALD